MSIALERSDSGGAYGIERPEFDHRSLNYASPVYNSTEFSAADLGFTVAHQVGSEDQSGSLSSSSTSSIGKNSDESLGGGGDEGEEVQSGYKGGPLDSMDDLEEVLPVKKCISKFYSGKSKSFTSLSAAASCSSIEEITKPEDAYSRKRKNLLAFNNYWDKNRNNILRSGILGISKRPSNSRSMLALVEAMNSSDTNSSETSISNSPSRGCCLPPRPPHARRAMHCELPLPIHADNFSPGRSFSLSDLQGAAAAEAANSIVTGLWTMKNEE